MRKNTAAVFKPALPTSHTGAPSNMTYLQASVLECKQVTTELKWHEELCTSGLSSPRMLARYTLYCATYPPRAAALQRALMGSGHVSAQASCLGSMGGRDSANPWPQGWANGGSSPRICGNVERVAWGMPRRDTQTVAASEEPREAGCKASLPRTAPTQGRLQTTLSL